MPRSPFEPWLRRTAGRAGPAARLTLAALAWSALPLTLAAGLTGDLHIEGKKSQLDRDGILTVEDAVLVHPDSDTRVTTKLALLVEKPGGIHELELTGEVHIDLRGAVLDAASAMVVFRNQELMSVQVRGSEAQAQFSHQLEGSSRRINGRADAIDYNAASGKVRFSGNTSYDYTDGSVAAKADVVTYDLNDGSAVADRGSGVFQLNRAGDRVPPPRTPDRESAQ